jgi:site-specific DNA recombinase
MPETAVVYLRVSTKDQAENGRSMDAQRASCSKWAEGAGREIVGLYRDRGVSGARADRKELEKALQAACQHKAAFVIYSLSRAARSTKHLLEIAERLKNAGASLVSCSENIDTTTPMGTLVFTILSALAQFERDLIKERTQCVMSFKVANREYTGSGDPPLGWMFDPQESEHAKPRHIIPEADGQGILKMIRALSAEGKGCRTIAAHLNDLGLAPRGRMRKTGTLALKWYPNTIFRLVSRLERLIVEE